MAVLGNVNIDGLSLSSAMKSDLSSGMSVAAFNSKYSSNAGFKPIGAHRQVGSSPAPSAPSAPAPNVSQPLFDYAAQFKAEQDALLGRQRAEQEGLFGQFENTMNSQEKLPDLYRRLETEAGLPELNSTAQGFKDEIFRVKGLLDRLDEDVTQRNTGTYTTEAMRRRIAQVEGDGMRTTLGRLGTGLEPVAQMITAAQGNMNTMMQLNMQEQEQQLQPIMMRINALGDRFARELTGFSNEKQQSLTAILDKLERDRFLSDRDWQLAQDLAAEQRAFERNKQLAKMSMASQYLSPTKTSSSNTSGGGGGSTAIPKLPTIAPLSVKPIPYQSLSYAPPPPVQKLSVSAPPPTRSLSVR